MYFFMSIFKKIQGLAALSLLFSAGVSLCATAQEPTADDWESNIPGFFRSFSDQLNSINCSIRSSDEIVNDKGQVLGIVCLEGTKHLCSITRNAENGTETARLPYTIDDEERILILTFADGKITDVKVDQDDGDTFEEQNSKLIGKLAPIPFRQPVGTTLGLPEVTFTVDESGHISVTSVTLTDLIKSNFKTLGEQQSQILDSVKISVSNESLEGIVKESNSSLFTSFQHLLGNAFRKEQDTITKVIKTISTNISLMDKNLQEHQDTVLGVTLDENGAAVNGSLLTQLDARIQQIAGKFGLTEDMIQTIHITSQLFKEHGQLPLYYSGSIEHMLFGAARIFPTSKEKLSISSMLLDFPSFYDLAGLTDYKDRIMTVATDLEEITKFLRESDLSTFNYVLPYLIGVFGNSFPIYDLAEEKISAYCESAAFSAEDYGLFAWVHSLYSSLHYLSETYEKNYEQPSTVLKQTTDDLKRLFDGKVLVGDVEQSPFPANHLGRNLATYQEILADCKERIASLRKIMPEFILQEQVATMQTSFQEQLTSLAAEVSEIHALLKKFTKACVVGYTYP